MRETISDIIHDLRPSILFPAISIGFILGLLLVILEISFAAMIFSGELSHLAARGVGLTLAGAFIACIVTSLFSPFKSCISLPQDAPVAIFSGVAALMAAGMSMTAEGMFITIVAALILTTLTTAVFLLLVAWFKLVHFFRYIPYPVIGGFLAGTGWILSHGSLEVMTGGRVNLFGPESLFSHSLLALWLPGAFLAFVLFFILRRFSHFLILPLALILGLVAFHLTLYLSDISLEEARKAGFLFEIFSTGRLWPIFSWSDFSEVNWNIVFTHIPILMTIPLITLIGLMLNMSGVELASKKEISMEDEITANGVSNALISFAGSPPAYSSLSLSMLGFKTGSYSRIVGLAAALVLLMTIIWGGVLISIFPKAVLGGFLLLLGLFFLWDWVIETWSKMTLADYLIVLTILGVIAWQGFFQGVVLGILLSVILFVVRFSHVPIMEKFNTGFDLQSPRIRPLPHKKILLRQGHRINIFELSGYLFFGSVNSLVSIILGKVEKIKLSDNVFVIIDMGKISGIDVSAVSAFVRMVNKLSAQGVTVIFTAAPTEFLIQLRHHLGQNEEEYFQYFSRVEMGHEWVEDRILNEQLRLFEKHDKHGQNRLFDEVADELLEKLEELEHLEVNLQSLKDYSTELHLNKNDTLLAPGQNIDGFFWMKQGKVMEVAGLDEREIFLAEYSPGDVINPTGVFDKKSSDTLFKAGTNCDILFFSLEKIREMEKQRPDLAARMYSLLLKRFIT